MDYIRLLPKNSLSRFVGDLARLENPKWLVDKTKSWFVKTYKLDMAAAERSLDDYKSLQDLFTRKLKPGIRPIGQGIVHPCDADLTQARPIEDGQLVQTKGITYSLKEFLKDPTSLDTFKNGTQLTYYLCPTDYHRVHSPVEGHIEQVIHVPGELWPVNPWSVENISQLFSRNERVIFRISTAFGPVAVVMIGATNVGEIEVSFDADIRTNVKSKKQVYFKTYKPKRPIAKGEELGIFHMGSSVVVVLPKGASDILPSVGPVKMGQSL